MVVNLWIYLMMYIHVMLINNSVENVWIDENGRDKKIKRDKPMAR